MSDLDPAHVGEIQWCECLPGPYYGAQLAGTTPLCQRCRRIPNEPWMHAALLAALVRAGVLERKWRNLRPCGCRAGSNALMCCDSEAPTTIQAQYVSKWEETCD